MDASIVTNLATCVGKSFILLGITYQTNLIPICWDIIIPQSTTIWYDRDSQRRTNVTAYKTNVNATFTFTCPGNPPFTLSTTHEIETPLNLIMTPISSSIINWKYTNYAPPMPK